MDRGTGKKSNGNADNFAEKKEKKNDSLRDINDEENLIQQDQNKEHLWTSYHHENKSSLQLNHDHVSFAIYRLP